MEFSLKYRKKNQQHLSVVCIMIEVVELGSNNYRPTPLLPVVMCFYECKSFFNVIYSYKVLCVFCVLLSTTNNKYPMLYPGTCLEFMRFSTVGR